MSKGKDGRYIAVINDWNSDRVFEVKLKEKQKDFLTKMMPLGISIQLLSRQGRREVIRNMNQFKQQEKQKLRGKEKCVLQQSKTQANSINCLSSIQFKVTRSTVSKQQSEKEKTLVRMSLLNLNTELNQNIKLWLMKQNLLSECQSQMKIINLQVRKRYWNQDSKVKLGLALEQIFSLSEGIIKQKEALVSLRKLIDNFNSNYDQFKGCISYVQVQRNQEDSEQIEESTMTIEGEKSEKKKQLQKKILKKQMKKQAKKQKSLQDTVLNQEKDNLISYIDEKQAISIHNILKSMPTQTKTKLVQSLIKDETDILLIKAMTPAQASTFMKKIHYALYKNGKFLPDTRSKSQQHESSIDLSSEKS